MSWRAREVVVLEGRCVDGRLDRGIQQLDDEHEQHAADEQRRSKPFAPTQKASGTKMAARISSCRKASSLRTAAASPAIELRSR